MHAVLLENWNILLYLTGGHATSATSPRRRLRRHQRGEPAAQLHDRRRRERDGGPSGGGDAADADGRAAAEGEARQRVHARQWSGVFV